MIMRDYITPEQRLEGLEVYVDIGIYNGMVCCGCDYTAEKIAIEYGLDENGMDENAAYTIDRRWFCHIDCFRDGQ